MKVTLDGIKAKIKGETYLVLPNGRTTVCQLTLENGYTVEGYSACVDPAEFDLNLGRKYAFEDAMKQIWPLEGYLLAEEMHNASLARKAIDDAFDVQYNSIAVLKKPARKTWTAKKVGRKTVVKQVDAPWGLKKDGTPKKKPGGTRK